MYTPDERSPLITEVSSRRLGSGPSAQFPRSATQHRDMAAALKTEFDWEEEELTVRQPGEASESEEHLVPTNSGVGALSRNPDWSGMRAVQDLAGLHEMRRRLAKEVEQVLYVKGKGGMCRVLPKGVTTAPGTTSGDEAAVGISAMVCKALLVGLPQEEQRRIEPVVSAFGREVQQRGSTVARVQVPGELLRVPGVLQKIVVKRQWSMDLKRFAYL